MSFRAEIGRDEAHYNLFAVENVSVHIKRIQVEDGFLDGLDVNLGSGLNVIIGERGTGKTSLIELVRFCLGSRSYTEYSHKRSLDHALSILGAGQVIITIAQNGRDVTISRSSTQKTIGGANSSSAIILSQTEIETLGLQANGRLRLLDGFIERKGRLEAEEDAGIAEVRSLTTEAESIRRELLELETQLDELPKVDSELAAHFLEEQKLGVISAEMTAKKTALEQITATLSTVAVEQMYFQRVKDRISRWHSQLRHVLESAPDIEAWTNQSRPDPLDQSRTTLNQVKRQLTETATRTERIISTLNVEISSVAERQVVLDNQSRDLRKQITAIHEGSGALARRGQVLRQRKAQLESLREVREAKRQALTTCLSRRKQSFDRLDQHRDERFEARMRVAVTLNQDLGPRIQVEIEKSGQFDAYASALANALRGSGLRYNDLAVLISEKLSPRELLDLVEAGDSSNLADLLNISKDRAVRLLVQLRESNLGEIATCLVEDNVILKLLDGQDYKDISDLSTGQRCTVILPIILEHRNRIIIVDQPEDHIDNAFITDTLIRALLKRGPSGQILFSTHNANIPVLGNADRVIHLGSDGKRGFVIVSGSLGSPDVVSAITTIMEGGADAFRQRASFYGTHAH